MLLTSVHVATVADEAVDMMDGSDSDDDDCYSTAMRPLHLIHSELYRCEWLGYYRLVVLLSGNKRSWSLELRSM